MSNEVMRQAQILCRWLQETPSESGFINAMAAQLDSEIAAALALPDAQPVLALYDQQALDLCDACGWKAKFPGEQCLNCNRNPTIEPQINWEDAGALINASIDARRLYAGGTSNWAAHVIKEMRKYAPQPAIAPVPASAVNLQLVPIEPSDAMLEAGKTEAHRSNGAREKSLRIYRAMLAAAKQTQPAEPLTWPVRS